MARMARPQPGAFGERSTLVEFNEGWVSRTLTPFKEPPGEEQKKHIEELARTVKIPSYAPDLTMVQGKKMKANRAAQKYARRRRTEGASLMLIAAELAALGYRSMRDGQPLTPSGLTTWLNGVALPGGRRRMKRDLVELTRSGITQPVELEASSEGPSIDVLGILKSLLNEDSMDPLKCLKMARQIVNQARP